MTSSGILTATHQYVVLAVGITTCIKKYNGYKQEYCLAVAGAVAVAVAIAH